MIGIVQTALWRAAMWAGLISLDITGCGPFMISQPVVTGPIFGLLMGQIRVGVLIGGIVQLIWMDVSPVGVGIPFDATAVTILAIYWACLQPDASLSHIVLALLLAVPFGYVFSFIDTYARRVNTWLARRVESVSDLRLPLVLDSAILAGLMWSWLRYTACYGAAMWIGVRILAKVNIATLPAWVDQGLIFAGALLPVAGLGVALELFLTEEPERRSLRVFKSRS